MPLSLKKLSVFDCNASSHVVLFLRYVVSLGAKIVVNTVTATMMIRE